MRIKYLCGCFLTVLLATVMLSACRDGWATGCAHVEVIEPAIAATCTENGKTESKHCSLCGEILVPAEFIDKTGHEEAIDGYVEATCLDEGSTGRKYCKICGETLATPKLIEILDHQFYNKDDISPTCTSWGVLGRTECSVCHTVREHEFIKPTGHSYEYGKCSVCNFKIRDYSNLDLYVSNEGYLLFSTHERGGDMRLLYDEMVDVLSEFHENSEMNATYYQHNDKLGDLYTVAQFNYEKYGLSLEEAQTVYSVFRKDYPIFYWMSYWLYWNSSSIRVTTVKEYANGLDREKCNELVYDGIERYVMLADGESDAYNIALVFYDAILDNNFYMRNSAGDVEPAQWAHGIIGAFTHGGFVCEGYAKLFQLLLNVSCIDNRYIVGDANGEHCWNLVRMDDGNWYWFDPTWGDNSEDRYKYFCVTDNAMNTHTPKKSDEFGLYFNGELPKRGTSAYQNPEFLEISEAFEVDGAEYVLCGAGKVRLKSGIAPLVDKVAYNGRVYDVVK